MKPIYDSIGLAPKAYIFVFAGMMIALGLVFRKRKMVEEVLLYTMCMVCMVSLSSAVANQYLAIPLAAFSLPLSFAYDAFGFVYLLGSAAGLHVVLVQTILPSVVNETDKWYFVECAILAIAIVWIIVRMTKVTGTRDRHFQEQNQVDASEKFAPHPRKPSMCSSD